MPRLRITPDVTDLELRLAIENLFAASHVIDDKLADRRTCDARVIAAHKVARDGIHDEIERLSEIIRVRRRALVTN
jgi:hypothetical protein